MCVGGGGVGAILLRQQDIEKNQMSMWYFCIVHVIPMWCACDTHVVFMWYQSGVGMEMEVEKSVYAILWKWQDI